MSKDKQLIPPTPRPKDEVKQVTSGKIKAQQSGEVIKK